MPKLGLKLFPDDIRSLPKLLKLIDSGSADYIEFFATPLSYEYAKYSLLDVKCISVIHAAHSGYGVELCLPERLEHNIACINEARRFADLVGAEHIIVHIGIEPDQEEALRQLKMVRDSRIILENRPVNETFNRNGTSSGQLDMLMNLLNIGLCLDFGHAIHAQGACLGSMEFLEPYLDLNPTMYHLYDGFLCEKKDQHLGLAEGNYPLQELISMIPRGKKVTLEVPKDYTKKLLGLDRDLDIFRFYS